MNQQQQGRQRGGGRGRGSGRGKKNQGQGRSKSPNRNHYQQQQQGPKSHINFQNNYIQQNNYTPQADYQNQQTPKPPQRDNKGREQRRRQERLKEMGKEERVKAQDAKEFQLLFQSLSNEDNQWLDNYNELVQQYVPLSDYLSRLKIQDDQYLSFHNLIHIMTRKKIQNREFLMEIMKSATFNIQVTEICSIFSQQADEVNFFQQEMEKLCKLFHWMFNGTDTTIFRRSCVSCIFNLQKIIECYYQKHNFKQLFNEYDQFLRKIYQPTNPIQYKNSPSYPIALEFIQLDQKKDYQLFGKLEKLNTNNLTLEKYLDYHYFVIREDYIRNLRIALSSLSETGFEDKINRDKISNINLYQNMQLISAAMNNYEVIWGITLEQFNMDGRIQKKIDWFKSKKLSSGNLICLTNVECYPLIFGVITNREDRQPSYEKDKRIKLEFKLLDPNVLMMAFLNLFSQKTIIIEYEDLADPIISYLDALKSKDQNFPFQNILIHGSVSISYPKYLEYGYTWRIDLANNSVYRGNQFNIFQEPWPKLQSTLDQSQQEAIKLMLKKEIALIQGPPGTGKTYCGALAVRLLVENLRNEDFPIMIVCYTNHALDQFLEHIIKFVPIADVARLGGSCKNPILKECQFRCQTQIRDFDWDKFKLLKSQIYNILDRKLSYDYKVNYKDIKNSWPELWERLISQFLENNNLHEDYLDKHSYAEIVTCWLERKKPSNDMLTYEAHLNGMYDYFTKKRISIDIQIKRVLKKETSQIIQQRDESSDEDIDVYLDSEDEPMYRNNMYLDESPHDINKKIAEAIKQFNKYHQNSEDLYYDYEGIQRIRIDIKGGNPWLFHEKDIMEIIRYIKCLKYQEDSVLFDRIYKEFQEMSQQLKSLYDQNEIVQLNQKKIIGVTITGVARQVKKLQKLNTKVMIIEEAAEVLESHIVSVLTPNLQHLILIGDHQQLKPKLRCYELEKDMEANVSLFEKLFKNKIPSITLSQQRRMKPNFADFIRLIYGPTYQDHNDTIKKQKTEIKGIIQDLVFFNHKWLENAQESSKENKKEGEMIFAMVQYLLNMGYDQSEISVLTLYLRQAQTIKRMFSNAKQQKIKVQTVDNYQGEENEIIILSLVRNNPNGQLGYIKIENRINVALSRAKTGLYVFGNFDFIYQNSEQGSLWQKVINLAKQKQCLQNSIKVRCLALGHTIDIQNPDDWERTRKGNCPHKCEKKFQNCVHLCRKNCHVGEHPAQNCTEKCDRIIDCGHKCTKMCKEKCECIAIVNLGLGCGHSVQAVCGTDPYTMKCQTQQEAFFKKCSHSVKYQCYQREQYIHKCTNDCQKILQCGHQCQKICYEECQPCKQACRKDRPCGHQNQCTKLCCEPCSPCQTLVNYQLKCGHSQQFKCGSLQEELKQYKCQQPCKLQSKCNHKTPCSKKCYENCSLCTVQVKCDLGCGHQQNFPCNSWYQDVVHFKCKENCIKKRSCGHQGTCTAMCYEACSPCEQIVPTILECGHVQQFTCCDLEKSKRNFKCLEPCNKKRKCGHESKCTSLCYQSCSPCQAKVNYELKCGHTQQFKCSTLQENLKNYRCEQPCKLQSKCNHKTLCTKKCFENCSECTILVKCELGCGHEKNFPCNSWYQDISSYKCKSNCIKKRPCGHQSPCTRQCFENCTPCSAFVSAIFDCGHSQSFVCSKFEEQKKAYQCQQECQKRRQCGHKDPCTNFCYQKCSPCKELLEKTLDCGHTYKVECQDFTKPIKCVQKCNKARECGHNFNCDQICSAKCSPCEMPLSVQLACGHSDHFKCHSKELELSKYKCKKICEKERQCGHKYPCENLCYQNCSPCLQQTIKTLNCGHTFVVNCCDYDKPIICDQQCIKERDCGHAYPCLQKCSSNCDQCRMKLNVQIQCQHYVQVECYNKTTFLSTYICKDNCNKPRPCGHNYPCNNFCYLKKECTPCFANVKKLLKCGHQGDVQCFQKDLKLLQIDCKEQCKKPRICGHDYPCDNLCFEACTPCCKIVEKQQKCGHKVKLQCSFTGYVQCTMPCIKQRNCGHWYPCNKRCFEDCAPCGEKIAKKLVCGHTQETICSKKHLTLPCSQPCTKIRDCGHQYPCAYVCSKGYCSPCETIVQKFCSNCFGTNNVKCHLQNTQQCDLPMKIFLKCNKHSKQIRCSEYKTTDLKCKECGDCVIF